ncbi:MAG: CorA family divalent cation transporter [Verrucomicrobiota bacterium JB022]|nr:CorA family divalent cation transporter [Verrucomicrobiota bacterium JB022]
MPHRRLPTDWALPHALLDRLTPSGGRQQALFADGHLLLYLHRLPDDDSPDREGVVFYRRPDGVWLNEKEPRGLLLLGEMLDDYDNRVDALDDRLDASQRVKDYYEILTAVHPILRAVRNLASTLDRSQEYIVDPELLPYIERTHVISRTAELLLTEAKMAMDYAIAQDSELQSQVNLEMAKSSHRLNLMVALFLPITALASVFGMNLTSGLEGTGDWLFWALMGIGALLGYLLRIFIERAQVPLLDRLKKQSDRLSVFIRPGNGNGHIK